MYTINVQHFVMFSPKNIPVVEIVQSYIFPSSQFDLVFLRATSSGYTGDLGATSVSQVITQWQGLGLEFLLTFVVVFVFFSSINPYRRSFGNPAIVIGFAYMACTLVGVSKDMLLVWELVEFLDLSFLLRSVYN